MKNPPGKGAANHPAPGFARQVAGHAAKPKQWNRRAGIELR